MEHVNFEINEDITVCVERTAFGTYIVKICDGRNLAEIVLAVQDLFKLFGYIEEKLKCQIITHDTPTIDLWKPPNEEYLVSYNINLNGEINRTVFKHYTNLSTLRSPSTLSLQSKNVDGTYSPTDVYIEFSTNMYLFEFLGIKEEIIKLLYSYRQYEIVIAAGKLAIIEIFNKYKISNPVLCDIHSITSQFMAKLTIKEFSDRLVLHIGYAAGYNVLSHATSLLKYLTGECMDMLVRLLKLDNYDVAKKIIIAEQEAARRRINNIIISSSSAFKIKSRTEAAALQGKKDDSFTKLNLVTPLELNPNDQDVPDTLPMIAI
jgi:hypothetical protein